jgi:hypothetical protein
VLLVLAAVASVAYGDHDVTWTIRGNNKLPKPLSDFTATLIPGTPTVLLAGGCDAELGNVFIPDFQGFSCSSLSNKLYSYNVKTDTYNELADMPSARARHAAVIVNNQLWIIGGRNAGDGLVGALDVSPSFCGIPKSATVLRSCIIIILLLFCKYMNDCVDSKWMSNIFGLFFFSI